MSTYAKKSIAQVDFYNYYKESSIRKNREYVDYKTYSNILKEANLLIRDSILYKAEKVQLPYRLGNLYVQKYENNYDLENIAKWKINWKETNKAGHRVFFESKYGYKWKWDKKKACFKGKKLYTFKACRKASRLVSDAVNNKHLDFYQ